MLWATDTEHLETEVTMATGSRTSAALLLPWDPGEAGLGHGSSVSGTVCSCSTCLSSWESLKELGQVTPRPEERGRHPPAAPRT